MSFAFLFSLTTFKAINVVFLVGIVSYPSVKKQKKTGNHWTITNHKKKKKLNLHSWQIKRPKVVQ